MLDAVQVEGERAGAEVELAAEPRALGDLPRRVLAAGVQGATVNVHEPRFALLVAQVLSPALRPHVRLAHAHHDVLPLGDLHLPAVHARRQALVRRRHGIRVTRVAALRGDGPALRQRHVAPRVRERHEPPRPCARAASASQRSPGKTLGDAGAARRVGACTASARRQSARKKDGDHAGRRR